MLFGKFFQHVESVIVTTLIKQHFCLRHHLHGVFFCVRLHRPSEIFVPRGECPHTVSCASGQQGGKRGGFSSLQRCDGCFFGTSKTTFEIVGERFIEGGASPRLGTPLLECPNPRWHGGSSDHRAYRDVTQDKTEASKCDGEIERELGSPKRQHNKHITVVVARGNNKADRDGKQTDRPKQGPHQFTSPYSACIGSRNSTLAYELQIARGIQTVRNIWQLT